MRRSSISGGDTCLKIVILVFGVSIHTFITINCVEGLVVRIYRQFSIRNVIAFDIYPCYNQTYAKCMLSILENYHYELLSVFDIYPLKRNIHEMQYIYSGDYLCVKVNRMERSPIGGGITCLKIVTYCRRCQHHNKHYIKM